MQKKCSTWRENVLLDSIIIIQFFDEWNFCESNEIYGDICNFHKIFSCICKSNSLFPCSQYCIISRKIPEQTWWISYLKQNKKKQSNIHSLNQEGYYYYKEQSTAIQKFTNFYLMKFFSHVFRNFTIKDFPKQI